MYKKIMSIVLLTNMIMVYAEQSQNNSATVQDIISFVRAHADEPTFCKKVVFTCEVNVSPEANPDTWRSIVHPFIDASILAHHDTVLAQNDAEKAYKWLDRLGFPLKNCVNNSEAGITGDISLGFTIESLSITSYFECCEGADAQIWKQTVLDWADFVEMVALASEKRDYESGKGVGELLKNVLQACGQEGLHAKIMVQWENAQGEQVSSAEFNTK